MNSAANKATRLSPRLSEAKILLRVTRLNRDKDERLEYVTGVKARSVFWYLDEEMEQRVATCEHTSIKLASNYPPSFDDYDEPIGFEFARYKNWPSIDRYLHFHEAPQFDDTVHVGTDFAAGATTAREWDDRLVSTAGFSAGATTWNRKESGRTRTPLNKLVVKERLTDIQELHLIDICVNIQQNHASAINTLDSFGKMVKTLWDQHHFGQLARGLRGLGGVLPLEIAKSRIKEMTDTAVASREGPTTFQSMFTLNQTNHMIHDGLITQPLPISSAIHPVAIHAASLPGAHVASAAVQPILPLSRRILHAGPKPAIPRPASKKRGRPKKQPVQLVPL